MLLMLSHREREELDEAQKEEQEDILCFGLSLKAKNEKSIPFLSLSPSHHHVLYGSYVSFDSSHSLASSSFFSSSPRQV